jgi:hypothetical protein
LGTASETDLDTIRTASKHIIELSLCGLGQVAPMPLLGMLSRFEDEFRAHIIDGVCPAGVCPVEKSAAPAARPRELTLVAAGN